MRFNTCGGLGLKELCPACNARVSRCWVISFASAIDDVSNMKATIMWWMTKLPY